MTLCELIEALEGHDRRLRKEDDKVDGLRVEMALERLYGA